MRRRLLVALVLAVLATGLDACGKREPPPTDAERLKAARAADAAGDEAARNATLRVLSASASEEGRIATTWLFQDALMRHDVVAALPLLERIVETFGGRGIGNDGVEHLQDTLAPVLVEEAALTARRDVEGPTPDLAAAKKALEVGRRAVAVGGVDEDDRRPLEAAAAYVALSEAPPDLSGLAPSPAAGAGPRVVVFADHFQLLEPVLPSVLKRWRRGLPVDVVGVLNGSIRRGIRREPAGPREERAAIEARARELDARFAGAVPEDAEAIRRLGIDVKGATVFVLAADGRLLARAAGRGLDPRPLDAVVVPLAPSTAPEK
jgi:hypothetical protein